MNLFLFNYVKNNIKYVKDAYILEYSTREMLKQFTQPTDIIFEVFKKPKRSFLFHVWDTFFDLIPSTSGSLLNDKVVYLIASEKSGKFVEIKNNKIVNETIIPSWDPAMKNSFKKITINNFVYKKYREIS